jgi:hypothetical protein
MTTTILFACLISALAGFLLARFFSGEEPGIKGKFGTLRIKVRDYVIHVHHWLYGGFLIMGFHHFFQSHPWPYQMVFYGFLAGIVIQGLTYPDFYRIIYKEPDFGTGADGTGDFLADY